MPVYNTYLIFLIEQFKLVINKAVFGAFLLPQRPLLLQLGTPEGLYAMHTGAELLVGQFELLLEVAQLPLQIGILRLQLSEEEGRRLAPVVVILWGRRRSVGAVVVTFEGLVSERTGSGAMVGASGGGAAALVGRRGRLIIAREVRAAARGTAVDLGQAAARTAAPFPPPPVLTARRPLLIRTVLAEIQLGSFPASLATHRVRSATVPRPLELFGGRIDRLDGHARPQLSRYSD